MPKISDLPTDTAPASTDLIPFVDVDAARTESVTVANLAASAAFSGQYAPLGYGGALARLPLDIPTYDDDPSITHPDVVHVPGGWNGYSYWMAFTPYPDQTRENPSVVASNNGVDWVVPTGGSNPVVPIASVEALDYLYNSDTDMLMLADGITMALYYRPVGGSKEAIYRITSTDGVTWGNATKVLGDTASQVSILSPAVVLEADGTYSMFTINRTGSSPYIMERRTSADGLTWASPTTCTVTSTAAFGDLWHVDVVRVGPRYYALVNESSTWRLRFIESADGDSWTDPSPEYAVPLLDTDIVDEDYTDGGHYRSTMVPVPGNPLRWDVYAATRRSGAGAWVIVLHKGVELPRAKFRNDLEAASVVRHRSNSWYATPFGNPTTGTLFQGNAFATPIFLPNCVIDEVGVEITTGVASSVCRLGIYADDRGYPGALIATDTIDATTTGFKYITLDPAVMLSGGMYWLAMHAATAGSAIGYRASRGAPISFPWPTRPSSSAFSSVTTGLSKSGISAGAEMLDPFAPNARTVNAPIMWVHTTTNSLALAGPGGS